MSSLASGDETRLLVETSTDIQAGTTSMSVWHVPGLIEL